MPKWIPDWLRRKPPQGSQEDLHLRSFFTNVEDLINYFTQQLSAKTFLKRIVIIYGLGGVGKSTLLIMFRLMCKERRIPVSIASGGQSVNEVQVLQTFADNLAGYGVRLPTFKKTLKKYRSIEAKVKQTFGASVSDAVNKAAEQYGYPEVGPVAGAGAALAVDWLHSFLTKPDLDLLLDPAKTLTRDFLADVTPIAKMRRLVLMIDHYEKMAAMDQWTCRLAQELPSDVLLVIVGRKPPGAAWERVWPGWMSHAHIKELQQMSEENMLVLVRRYYSTMRGGEPDPEQVVQIIKFARGLPLAVTTTVGLWVKYGREDIKTVKPEVLADLADRVLEDVSESLRPLLEAAASVRWFNKDVLKAVTGQRVSDKNYRELRNLKEFIRPRPEGPFMVDAVREIIDDNLKAQQPTRHKTLHESAANYFEESRKRASDEDKESLLVEQLYHEIRADEDAGIKFFRQLCEDLSRAGLVRQLRTLVGELALHSLVRDGNRLWVDYYATRIMHLEGNFQEAQDNYESISIHQNSDALLKAYSLCDLGNILTRWERLGQRDGPKKAKSVLERALSFAPLEIHLSNCLFDLGRVYEYLGNWAQATNSIEKAREFFHKNNDSLGMVYALNGLLAAYVLHGDWRGMITAQRASLDLLRDYPEYTYLKAKTLGYWSWAWPMAGRYAEAEANLNESLRIIRQVEDLVTLPTYLRNLGLSIGMQGRYVEAYIHIDESLTLAKGLGKEFAENWATSLAIKGIIQIKQRDYIGAKDCLDKSLSVKMDVKDNLGISEAMVLIAALSEAQQQWDEAADYYERSLQWKWTGRRYYEAAALVGLCRVRYQQRRLDDLKPLIPEAEMVAAENGYYDHLSSLRVIQGNLASESQSAKRDADFDRAHRWYHQALVCALRYNRFLLDDTVGLIDAYGRERGGEGQRMLAALHDSWSKGRNKIGGIGPEGISPLPEGVALSKAEDVARQREPGNGERQETVLQRLSRFHHSG